MSRRDRHDRLVPPLATQLVVPETRLRTVERPALLERLEAGAAGPVTLVCAPAGSGKTTLVAAAARACADPVAWVSLEPTDDDPHRLWTAVRCALELAGRPAAGLPEPEGEYFTTRLVNALADLPGRAVLVLDDVHVLRSRDCLAQLAFLVLHAPGTLRLVLVARSDPELPLHVLRVRGGLLELRAADLAFTREEAAALLRTHGVSLPDELVAALHARTEGWAAGLRLAALGLQDHADPERFVAELAGDDRVVGDYLLAEVLSRLPTRAFLLRTAVVDRLCGSLADALTGRHDGAETLAELSRTNGFVIPVDVRGEWFRYHTLFAGLLRARAQRELAGELPELHARAARWYAARGAGVDAMRHAIAAGAWGQAAEMVAAQWFALHVSGDGEAVRRLAGGLPLAALGADASAALAFLALDAADADAAARHCADARVAARELPPARTRRFLATMGFVGLAQARARGDLAAADAAAEALLREPVAGQPGREAVVRLMLGQTARWARELGRAREEAERAFVLAQCDGLDCLAAAALSDLALAAAAEDPAAAAGHAEQAIALWRRGARARGRAGPAQLAGAHVALAVAAFAELRSADAAAHLERAAVGRRDLELVVAELTADVRGALDGPVEGLRAFEARDSARRRGPRPPHEPAAWAAARARLLVAAGALDDAEAALAPVRGAAWPALALAEAQLLLARGRPEEAAEALDAAAAAPDPGRAHVVQYRVLQAVAAGDAAGAGRALEAALAAAEATRQLRPFVAVGRRMEDLLRDRIRQGTAHRALVDELLDVLGDRHRAPRSSAPLLEPLSGREETILRYLPTTLSNREIASELFVTTNTVKSHLRSIYRKLDVARRREAVERARELRLLSTGSRR